MKIRTVEELEEVLVQEWLWRKIELHSLKSSIKPSRDKIDTPERAAVALSYAHLEGFFKNATTAYLNYLSNQPVPVNKLNPIHQAKAVVHELKKKNVSFLSEPVQIISECLVFLEKNGTKGAKLPFKSEINTESNLSYPVMQAILLHVGLPENMFSLKENILNAGLLKSRNAVAHGDRLFDVSPSQVLAWVDMVLEMCESLKTELVNNAVRNLWMRSHPWPLERSSVSAFAIL